MSIVELTEKSENGKIEDFQGDFHGCFPLHVYAKKMESLFLNRP